MYNLKDEKILSALISCGSIREASKVAKVSPSTIRNKLQDTEFKQRYQEAKDHILTEVCDTMTARLTTAVDTLYNVMQDSETPSSVRISAADSILRHSLRYIETADIIKRIQALEEQQ